MVLDALIAHGCPSPSRSRTCGRGCSARGSPLGRALGVASRPPCSSSTRSCTSPPARPCSTPPTSSRRTGSTSRSGATSRSASPRRWSARSRAERRPAGAPGSDRDPPSLARSRREIDCPTARGGWTHAEHGSSSRYSPSSTASRPPRPARVGPRPPGMEPRRRPAPRLVALPADGRGRRRDRRLRPPPRPPHRPAGHGPQRGADRVARAHHPPLDPAAARRRDRPRRPDRARQAGTLWLEVTEAATPHGLSPLSGSSPDVGVVGYTLGGGLSWLARKHGLAADSVTAIELVTPAGERRPRHRRGPRRALLGAARRRRQLRRRDRDGVPPVPLRRGLRRLHALPVRPPRRGAARLARLDARRRRRRSPPRPDHAPPAAAGAAAVPARAARSS